MRHKILTEKGKYYELEQVNDLFISLRNITEKTLTLLSIHSSYDVIRNNYHCSISRLFVSAAFCASNSAFFCSSINFLDDMLLNTDE
jgi:hypothetical protein